MSRAANSLKTSDVIATPIKLKYTASYDCSTLETYKISVLTGINGPVTITGSVPQETLNYLSVRHLFYSNFLTGSYPVSASSADNYIQSTAASGTLDADLRYFPTESGAQIRVLSIPRGVFGQQVSRHGFAISSSAYYLADDGNGNIIDQAANNTHVGNIIYPQGLVIITNSDYLEVFPYPPIAVDDYATFYTTDSPKTFDILTNDDPGTGTLIPSSVVLSGDDVALFTNNLDGTVTLTATTPGLYTTYYTVQAALPGSCNITSNQAMIEVDVTTPVTPGAFFIQTKYVANIGVNYTITWRKNGGAWNTNFAVGYYNAIAMSYYSNGTPNLEGWNNGDIIDFYYQDVSSETPIQFGVGFTTSTVTGDFTSKCGETNYATITYNTSQNYYSNINVDTETQNYVSCTPTTTTTTSTTTSTTTTPTTTTTSTTTSTTTEPTTTSTTTSTTTTPTTTTTSTTTSTTTEPTTTSTTTSTTTTPATTTTSTTTSTTTEPTTTSTTTSTTTEPTTTTSTTTSTTTVSCTAWDLSGGSSGTSWQYIPCGDVTPTTLYIPPGESVNAVCADDTYGMNKIGGNGTKGNVGGCR
jgi:hypothetical protein